MTTIIGISTVGKEKKVGSMYTAMVYVDEKVYKKLKKFNFKGKTKGVVEDLSGFEGLYFSIYKTKPAHFKKPVNELESEANFSLLNTVREFHKQKIFFHSKTKDEEFEECVKSSINNYLKGKKLKKLKFDDKETISNIAFLFASYFELKELVENKIIYGLKDEDSFIKETPDSPIIRG